MTPKIRKLYNVLVIGGAMAAGGAGCTKDKASDDKPAATSNQKPDPKPEAPKPAAAEPAKSDTAATDDKKDDKDKDGKKVTVKKPNAAPAATETKGDAKDDKAKGSGVTGWS
jgi:hypothetical protein